MLKIIVLILLLTFSIFSLNAQDFDTSELLLNAKIKILQVQNSFFHKKDICTIINGNCKFKFLNSKGFIDIIFFEIKLTKTKGNKDTLNEYINPIGNYDYNYIFGYNTINKELYKLNGFIDNDFYHIYNFLHRDYDSKTLKSKIKFLEKFRIENLDLDCLYSYLNEYKHKNRINLNYDCVTPAKQFLNNSSWLYHLIHACFF